MLASTGERDEADSLRGLGLHALEQNQASEALENLSRAVALDPSNGFGLGLLGVAAARAGNDQHMTIAIEQACRWGEEQIGNVLRVCTWFADTRRLGDRFSVRDSVNWCAVEHFAAALLERFAIDERTTFLFARTAYHHQLLKLARTTLSRYVARYGRHPEILGMLIDTQLSLCDLEGYQDFVANLFRGIQDDLAA